MVDRVKREEFGKQIASGKRLGVEERKGEQWGEEGGEIAPILILASQGRPRTPHCVPLILTQGFSSLLMPLMITPPIESALACALSAHRAGAWRSCGRS